jgi:hypothetical protein
VTSNFAQQLQSNQPIATSTIQPLQSLNNTDRWQALKKLQFQASNADDAKVVRNASIFCCQFARLEMTQRKMMGSRR